MPRERNLRSRPGTRTLGAGLAVALLAAPLASGPVRGADADGRATLSASAQRALAGVQVEGAGGYVNFSFDKVDVASFVKLVGELTDRKFVLGQGIEGTITVVSPQVKRAEIYPLFVSILESAGCSLIEEGAIHRVVSLPERPAPFAPVTGAEEAITGEGLITKVFHLENVPVADLRKAIEPHVMGGKAGAVGALEETNHLIVTDTASVLRRIAKIVDEIDRPGMTRTTEIVPLQFAEAEQLARELNAAVEQDPTRAQQLARRMPRPRTAATAATRRRSGAVIPSAHSNSLILVGTAAQIAELRDMIKQMDVDVPSGRGRLNAIFLKYLSADEAAVSINKLLEKSMGKKPATGEKPGIAIEANGANNALLVDASPGDFEIVKDLVDQLDRQPQQVHISVMIAELKIGDDLEWAVELAAIDLPETRGDYAFQGSSRLRDSVDGLMSAVQTGIFPGGLTVGLAYGSRIDDSGNVVSSYPAAINIDAVKRDSRFNVLSETALEVEDNREASVNIVDEIPILSSTVSGGSGTARDVIQNIERVEVGIKLKLTPHVIPGGDVRMELKPSIEAVVDPGPSDVAFTPTIARRDVQTTVTVPDGRTIVIAGLTRTDKTQVKRRVPILGSIPLLGLLFRDTIDSTVKTDLLVFVTPRIVTSPEVAEQLREEWETKTGLHPHEQE